MTPDREKVIKGLECHAKGSRGCLFDCPYGNENGCQLLLCSDALALLKEQETVEHAKEILCANGWEKLRFPEGTIGKWDDPEIVRCKDCKNADYGTDEDGNRFMKCIGSVRCYGGTTPDWFCADGERK